MNKQTRVYIDKVLSVFGRSKAYCVSDECCDPIYNIGDYYYYFFFFGPCDKEKTLRNAEDDLAANRRIQFVKDL